MLFSAISLEIMATCPGCSRSFNEEFAMLQHCSSTDCYASLDAESKAWWESWSNKKKGTSNQNAEIAEPHPSVRAKPRHEEVEINFRFSLRVQSDITVNQLKDKLMRVFGDVRNIDDIVAFHQNDVLRSGRQTLEEVGVLNTRRSELWLDLPRVSSSSSGSTRVRSPRR